MRKVVLLMAAIGITLAAAPGWCTYSGLVVMPTAETVGAGNYSLLFQVDGPLKEPKADTKIINTEFGIGDRIEAGIDFDFSEQASERVYLNAKYLFHKDDASGLYGAIGYCGLGFNLQSSPYGVVTKDFKMLRGHMGWIRSAGYDRWMAGIDSCITDKITLMADYIEGEDNTSSVGIDYVFDDNIDVLAGVVFPNAGGDPTFTIQFNICASIFP